MIRWLRKLHLKWGLSKTWFFYTLPPWAVKKLYHIKFKSKISYLGGKISILPWQMAEQLAVEVDVKNVTYRCKKCYIWSSSNSRTGMTYYLIWMCKMKSILSMFYLTQKVTVIIGLPKLVLYVQLSVIICCCLYPLSNCSTVLTTNLQKLDNNL